jgi:hypothetical protein
VLVSLDERTEPPPYLVSTIMYGVKYLHQTINVTFSYIIGYILLYFFA